MSNNKTVPSAETILKEKGITGLTANHNYQYLHRSILESMHEYTRLHLEAMRNEVDFDLMTLEDTIKGSDGDLITKIRGKLTDYITKIK